MFDSIGRNVDAEAGHRHLAAMGLTLAITGSGIGAVLLYGAWVATRYVLDHAPADAPLVEVVVQDPVMGEDLPPPPPPPAGTAHPAAHPDTHPDEMSPDVKALDDRVADIVHDAQAAGPQGQPNGQAGGQPGGVPGGVVGGTPGGQGSGGVHVFHHSEVKIKRRVALRYPHAAAGLHLGEVVCRVEVSIDEHGVPYDIEPEGCPSVFHPAVKDALYRWRWYPARVAGQAVKGQFLMAVRFVP